MTAYHLLGIVSSVLFLLTWLGLLQQINTIELRRRSGSAITRHLSVNQFTSSYFAFYGNFIFGISLQVFNHYLVWTRLGALILTLVILFRIYRERQSTTTAVAFWAAFLALLAGCVSMAFRPYPGVATLAANGMMLVLSALLIQGTLHQFWTVYKAQEIGAVSINLFRSILIKDLSTLLFALTMPIATAWPLLVLNGASTLTRGALLIQLEWLRHRSQPR